MFVLQQVQLTETSTNERENAHFGGRSSSSLAPGLAGDCRKMGELRVGRSRHKLRK